MEQGVALSELGARNWGCDYLNGAEWRHFGFAISI